MNATCHIHGLRHHHGERCVLELPELELTGPGTVALVGPNGAGKTTLLRLLCGRSASPDQGRLEWNVTPEKRVLVDQSPYLFTTSVARNVGYGPRVRRVSPAELAERVREALARVGLEGFESRPARELSGGEQRRVAIARALAVDPQVLLLDEPDAGLDAASAAALEKVIAGLGTDRLVVFSTHDADRARRLAGRVIPLSGGRVNSDLE